MALLGYYNQFESFDPVSGSVPEKPFTYLSAIAQRARLLLNFRNSKQIDLIAGDVDWVVDEYLNKLRKAEIAKLKVTLGDDKFERYFDWVGDAENGQWELKEDMEDGLTIPTPENLGEVDALKECADRWLEIGGNEITDCKPYEIFASLSLWMLADAIGWLFYRSKFAMDEFSLAVLDLAETKLIDVEQATATLTQITPDCFTLEPSVFNLSLAGEYAIKAMDAVCYAEQLHLIENMQNEHTANLSEAKNKIKKLESQRQEELRKKQVRHEALNRERHKNDAKAKAMVIEKWKNDPSLFSSFENAAKHFKKVLEKELDNKEQRTLVRWISEYAKTINFSYINKKNKE